ncbi:hypothetical protein [Nodularia sp. NIES-3585]|uniref:hypothetical protein n=1 Tax=Nodularia sp. NIES-3585 TaxID=1973477 RepID=UPI00113174AE|nr:hypothetical protein [Nodularia sp. NIES-3585]
MFAVISDWQFSIGIDSGNPDRWCFSNSTYRILDHDHSWQRPTYVKINLPMPITYSLINSTASS